MEHIFPNEQTLEKVFPETLLYGENLHFQILAVPGGKQPIGTRVSQPRPDGTYGYDFDDSFSISQRMESSHMAISYGEVAQGLIFPFLLAEFKGTEGSISVALNQSLGGSATCVNVMKSLNRLASEYGVDPVDSTAFSVTSSGHVAYVYVMWEDGECFLQQQVAHLALCEDGIRKLRNIVTNILTWGKETRLPAIKAALDKITEARLKSEKSLKRNGKKRDHSPEAKSDKKRGKSHS